MQIVCFGMYMKKESLIKKHNLLFAEENRNTFEQVLCGRKKIETRAGNTEYEKIQKGDSIIFSCGSDSFEKKVINVTHFKSVEDLTSIYSPEQINSEIFTTQELIEKYHEFPGYRDRIAKFGILAFELE